MSLRVIFNWHHTFFKVRSCLESFIDLGYDLSLFESEELEIICQKQGYLVWHYYGLSINDVTLYEFVIFLTMHSWLSTVDAKSQTPSRLTVTSFMNYTLKLFLVRTEFEHSEQLSLRCRRKDLRWSQISFLQRELPRIRLRKLWRSSGNAADVMKKDLTYSFVFLQMIVWKKVEW